MTWIQISEIRWNKCTSAEFTPIFVLQSWVAPASAVFEWYCGRVRLLEEAVLKQPEMWQLLGERIIPREMSLEGLELWDAKQKDEKGGEGRSVWVFSLLLLLNSDSWLSPLKWEIIPSWNSSQCHGSFFLPPEVFLQDLPGGEVFDCVVFGNVLCEVPDQEVSWWTSGAGWDGCDDWVPVMEEEASTSPQIAPKTSLKSLKTRVYVLWSIVNKLPSFAKSPGPMKFHHETEEVFCHVNRLLKPGGRVYFSEHTLSSTAVTRFLQHLASPFWWPGDTWWKDKINVS